jgi:Zn-dependent protease
MDNAAIYIQRGLAALIAIMFHEIAHGLAAYKLGDTTAKESGRLSLNPIRHIDLFGLLMLIAVGFGWAKPVPVDMRYFKNPRIGMAIVAFAGPAMNFLMALVAMLVYAALVFFGAAVVFTQFFYILIMINIGLGIFNLFPIPPLDGSKILMFFLGNKAVFFLERNSYMMRMILLISIIAIPRQYNPIFLFIYFVSDFIMTGLNYATFFLGLL